MLVQRPSVRKQQAQAVLHSTYLFNHHNSSSNQHQSSNSNSNSMYWSREQITAAYHFNRFTAGWRKLLVFYVAMFLAGYAKNLQAFAFYAAWGALVLMYWEPYLSPPFPWMSDKPKPIQDTFGVLLQLGFTEQPSSTEAAQWVLAIQRGLNQTQLRVYTVIYGAIIIPFAFLVIGMVKQATSVNAGHVQEKQDIQAVYADALLLALMTVYTASVFACLWIFHCVRAQESQESRANEPQWQPKDMMFFMCKILGETLNTVVQTLVAGSFIGFMPDQIFWLCILITSLSYTATNLLYDFDSNAPVSDEPVTPWGCPMFRQTGTIFNQQQQQQQDVECSMEDESCDGIGPEEQARRIREDSAWLSKLWADCSFAKETGPVCDHVAADAEQYQARTAAAAAPAQAPAGAASCSVNRQPLPPFLKYKWPKGARGKTIIWLLMLVAVPSVMLLRLTAKGCGKAGQIELLLSDLKGECTGDSCLWRYQQLLVILGCLGCLISYYAFTVGFLGAGPVTWLYQVCARKEGKR